MTEIEPDSSGEGLRVGIVRSRFNERIGVAMLEACRKRLGELRVTALTVVSVPGALEAPLALQKLANTEKYDALIALGAVIRGDDVHLLEDQVQQLLTDELEHAADAGALEEANRRIELRRGRR